MTIVQSDDKLVSSMTTMMMMMVGTIMMLSVFQQLLPQQAQAQAATTERYGMWWFGSVGYIMNVAYGPDEEPEYFGEAVPGTPNDYPGWRIYKYEYVTVRGTGDFISGSMRFADGTTAFDKVWDNRADYDYS